MKPMKYFHIIYSQFNLLGDTYQTTPRKRKRKVSTSVLKPCQTYFSVQGLSRLANCPTSNNCIAASYYTYGALYTISTSVYLFAIALSYYCTAIDSL